MSIFQNCVFYFQRVKLAIYFYRAKDFTLKVPKKAFFALL